MSVVDTTSTTSSATSSGTAVAAHTRVRPVRRSPVNMYRSMAYSYGVPPARRLQPAYRAGLTATPGARPTAPPSSPPGGAAPPGSAAARPPRPGRRTRRSPRPPRGLQPA
ncbi:hypothetical protein FXF59_26395 [Microbispora tritici]|uniref:Uncharacterized protein n=1 Tax=Microbispora tritici TaxID=2604471 RepID=A0ABY3LST3_9ACTN|nr:hypothetical protein FXF59_26395 [Microbispora tritici]